MRVIGAVDVWPDRHVAQCAQCRVNRYIEIGIDPGRLHAAVPDVSVNVGRMVRGERQDGDSQQGGRCENGRNAESHAPAGDQPCRRGIDQAFDQHAGDSQVEIIGKLKTDGRAMCRDQERRDAPTEARLGRDKRRFRAGWRDAEIRSVERKSSDLSNSGRGLRPRGVEFRWRRLRYGRQAKATREIGFAKQPPHQRPGVMRRRALH